MSSGLLLFDPLQAPLHGRTLIEASAGTGKTWTIAALYVRLLVEVGLEVEQILVVTYTEAATAELRERVRARLGEALAACAGQAGDDFLLGLVARSPDLRVAASRLRRALLDFDQAAIHTIHGFCQRVLRDRAFEARALFDTELATDLSSLEEELADDFWRRRSATFSPVLVDYLLDRGYGPDALVQLQRQGRPPERILPEVAAGGLAVHEAQCCTLFEELATLWQREAPVIVAGVQQALPGLHGGSYSEVRLRQWERELELFCRGTSLWGAGKALERLAHFRVKKGGAPPEHPFHPLCGAFLTARAELTSVCEIELLALQRDYLLWRPVELARRKEKRNLRTFDDLLLDVRAALTADGGGGLLPALRATYRAVLIDEFQDTDPVQYAIFDALCPDERACLFLIGDPKQAIYAFRGADIFTYLAAARRVERRFTLGVNRRSSSGLVDAVNRCFSRSNPFLFDAIPYPEVTADYERNAALAIIDGRTATSLQLWSCSPAVDYGTKEESVSAIVAAVVGEIVRLLNEGARLRSGTGDERPLCAGDIAVLVRTNREAAAVIEGLQRAGVAGVRQGSESLFASRELLDLLGLLHSLAAPHDPALLRGALATPYLGFDAAALAETVADPAALEIWLERWGEYHQLWAARGIAVLSGSLMQRERLAARLLALPDGERRLTNLRHGFEVLHRAECELGLGMEGLLKWLSRHIAAPPPGEEYQLRLETDVAAVQVVTIHRSKGLEYPVCFVPFCWSASRISAQNRNKPLLFHLPGTGDERGPLCLDLGSGADERERYLQLCEREALAENLRLAYVALTRAQARCYLVWGALRGAESSALAWLLHAPASVASGEELAACEAAMAALDDAALTTRLRELTLSGPIAVEPLPAGGGILLTPPAVLEALAAPPPWPEVRNLWRLTSYSALTAGSHHPAEGELWRRSERGEAVVCGEEAPERRTLHDFPAGAEAGSCLHDILERVDFTAGADSTRRDLVAATLRDYRIAPEWSPVVDDLLTRLFAAPLDPAVPGLVLGRVGFGQRSSEMGFFLPLARLTAADLAATFDHHRAALPDARLPASLAQLAFGAIEGMLRGFIDLVFVHDGRYYLVDWKSNRLGRTAADYDQGAMAAEMLASGYLLQYHLYTLALHRHLARTLPDYAYERHFGGVFYLFLRGIDPSLGDYGIYRDRPCAALITALDRLLEQGANS